MTIGIIGGSGFLGTHLTHYLLERTDWRLKVISRQAKPFEVSSRYADRVEFISGDVSDLTSISAALAGVDTAYYFVHMMGHKGGDFYAQELQAAQTFKQAVGHSRVRRLVYMGGLGRDEAGLSRHLASRHRTGALLRTLPIEVIELRASMIIGRGSVAFDIIANLVDKLPVMVLPGSASTLTQPIALSDALAYLWAAATVPLPQPEVIEIGGPHVLSYRQVYEAYARFAGRHRLIVRAPFVPAWLEALFLNLFTPRVHARIGQAMVESLANEMVVTSPAAGKLFPDIKPVPIEQAFREA